MALNIEAYSMKPIFRDATVEPGVETSIGRDEADLTRYGKKQQLRVCNFPPLGEVEARSSHKP